MFVGLMAAGHYDDAGVEDREILWVAFQRFADFVIDLRFAAALLTTQKLSERRRNVRAREIIAFE